jgi:L-lactate dehydrogenase (cytochrome)
MIANSIGDHVGSGGWWRGAVELARMLRIEAPRSSVDRIESVADARRLAHERLPRMVADFVDGGAEDELTLRANRRDLERICLIPRMLVDVSDRTTATTFAGERLSLPFILGPAGLAQLVDPEGELAVVRAAGRAGTVFVAGMMSSYSLEEIAGAATGPLWFQLYPWRDRELLSWLIERAQRAGYRALVLTVDVPVIGRRERDLRNGMMIPPRVGLRSGLDVARSPRWLRGLLRGRPIGFGNLQGIVQGEGAIAHNEFIDKHYNPAASWDDVAWVRAAWKGPLLIKGVMTGQDARMAQAHGVDGVVVSNHGGRQLDGATSSARALVEVVESVGSEMEIVFDGGIRRGADIMKAVAIGAGATMSARCWFWGLGAAGEAGVVRVLELLRSDVQRCLALMGRTCPRQLGRDAVVIPHEWLERLEGRRSPAAAEL